MTGEHGEVAPEPLAAGRLCWDAVVVMGVAGSGKTTVAAALARRLNVTHLDADDFHPRHNIDKMTAGTPLTDVDRMPWLRRLRAELDSRAGAGEPVVLACSALKRTYRDILRSGTGTVGFVYLRIARDQLATRLVDRGGHFFAPALIDSQLATLEEPDPGEHALTIDATVAPEHIVWQVCADVTAA